MLAKIWKKLLLAICIIACIYNVMNKIVKHTSLDTQLKSILHTKFEDDEEKNIEVETNSNFKVETQKEEDNGKSSNEENIETEEVKESEESTTIVYLENDNE